MTIAEKLTTIAENEQKVYDAGYSAGQADGGYNEGFDAGKQAEYNRFWDAYQANGTRTGYSNAFYNWRKDAFNPKYPIWCRNSNGANSTFAYSYIQEILVDVEITNPYPNVWTNNANMTFYNADGLVTITKLILDESVSFPNTFYNCKALQNITIEGVIGNNINLSYSPLLTHGSLMSIINHLQIKTSGSYVLTLGTTNLAKLTDTEKAIATEKGWTLA